MTKKTTKRQQVLLYVVVCTLSLFMSSSAFAYTCDSFTKAATSDNVSLAKSIVKSGVKINCRMKNGQTPLHIAAVYGAPKLVEYLLSNDAKVNAKSAWGSPLDAWYLGWDKFCKTGHRPHCRADYNKINGLLRRAGGKSLY